MAEQIVRSGTEGLDGLFAIGGFLPRSSVLVSGEPGAGKSILAMQFIYNGAREYGESGVYVTSEQNIEKVRSIAKNLGMDFEPLEKKGLITLMKVPVARGYEMVPEDLVKLAKKPNIKRMVIDSITPFQYVAVDVRDFRVKLLALIETLTKENITLLVTAEKMRTDFDNTRFNAEDFLFDGLILMGRMHRAASFERVLSVIKMRGTAHSNEMHPIEISGKGLAVKTLTE